MPDQAKNIGNAVVDLKTGATSAAMHGWQPIESAPRNEEWCVVGRIRDGKLLWWYRAMFWRGGWHTSRSYDTRIVPSHYLPLPDPSCLSISDRGIESQASKSESV